MFDILFIVVLLLDFVALCWANFALLGLCCCCCCPCCVLVCCLRDFVCYEGLVLKPKITNVTP